MGCLYCPRIGRAFLQETEVLLDLAHRRLTANVQSLLSGNQSRILPKWFVVLIVDFLKQPSDRVRSLYQKLEHT